MSRFAAAPAGAPAKAARSTPPHRFRLVGDRVLVVDDTRRFAFLTTEEHAAWLRGKPSPDVQRRLDAAGFGAVDVQGLSASSLAGWRGPRRFVLLLERGARRLSPELARAALDFAFSSPSPGLVVELACESADAVLPALRFCVEYAQRRAEWGKRRLSLVARAQARAEPRTVEWLAARGVERRTRLSLSGLPAGAALPGFAAQTAEALADAEPSSAAAWMRWLSRAGLRSARLSPASEEPAARARFLRFYAAALDALACDEASLVEEGLRALAAEPRWALPGLDVLEEVCCDETGRLFSSERAAGLPAGSGALFLLGRAGELRLSDLVSHPAARAALAAAEPESQPLCRTCAYAPFCAVPASWSCAAQGTIWGRVPDSPGCALNMGRLDAFFGLVPAQKTLDLLTKYGVDTSSQSC